MKQNLVVWTLPQWAADLFHETLTRDSRSTAFDPNLRKQLASALSMVTESRVREPRPVDAGFDLFRLSKSKQIVDVSANTLRVTTGKDCRSTGKEKQSSSPRLNWRRSSEFVRLLIDHLSLIRVCKITRSRLGATAQHIVCGQTWCRFMNLAGWRSAVLRRSNSSNHDQQWEVCDTRGRLRFFSRSRAACLDWEQKNLNG